MTRYLYKIRIYFTIMVILLIFFIGGGVSHLQESRSRLLDYQHHILRSVKSEITYASVALAYMAETKNRLPQVFSGENRLATSIPVLLYHGLVNTPDGENISPEVFRKQMFALKEAGYNTVSIEDFYAFIRGRKQLPDKSFLLTFDDSRKDSYYPADPILKVVGYRAVMYVITGRLVSNNFHLTTPELKQMQNSGRWDLQSHGKFDHDLFAINADGAKGHFLSNKLWLTDQNRLETDAEYKKRVYTDLADSKNDMERIFGVRNLTFAYPFSDFGNNRNNNPIAAQFLQETVHKMYPISFYQTYSSIYRRNYADPNSTRLGRIYVSAQWSAEELLRVLETSGDKSLPFSDDFSVDRGWLRGWGSTSISEGTLRVEFAGNGTGGNTVLDGTRLWKDYEFSAQVMQLNGSTVTLVARQKQPDSYVACNFSDHLIGIEQVIENKRNDVTELFSHLPFRYNNAIISIKVAGQKVQCLKNGYVIASADTISPLLDRGGIGIKTWDPIPTKSNVIIQNISVQ